VKLESRSEGVGDTNLEKLGRDMIKYWSVKLPARGVAALAPYCGWL
jgi:hypothetical protein